MVGIYQEDSMKNLKTLSISAVFAVSVLAGVAILVPRVVSAQAKPAQETKPSQEAKPAQESKPKPEAQPTQETKPAPSDQKQEKPANSTTARTSAYKYVAQKDDTYSQMVRKAIQTYGKKNNVKISRAKIIAAETNITQAAGSPLLNVGQMVEISETAVKDWVEKTQKFTVTQEAAWNQYTAGVNFNTDTVGEVR
jgi:hypothetical protein